MDYNNIEFEDMAAKSTISDITIKLANYDVYDIISRIAGLNILSEKVESLLHIYKNLFSIIS